MSHCFNCYCKLPFNSEKTLCPRCTVYAALGEDGKQGLKNMLTLNAWFRENLSPDLCNAMLATDTQIRVMGKRSSLGKEKDLLIRSQAQAIRRHDQ